MILKNKKLHVTVEVYENWHNQDGSVKKKDILNKEKFLIDSVFKGLEIDDMNIFDCRFIKVQSEEEKSIIRIREL